MPQRSRTCATIEDVVVLPCAPATAIVRFSALSSASSSARGRSGSPRLAAAARSGLSGAIAVECTTSTSSPGGHVLRRVADVGVDAQRAQLLQAGRLGAVGAATPSRRGPRAARRVAAHPGAAEPDEVQAPPRPGRRS